MVFGSYFHTKNRMMKTLALSELRRVAERTRLVRVPLKPEGNLSHHTSHSARRYAEVVERIPWRVWYVAASNGDCIRGEECVTIAVYPDAGAYGARLVQFTGSGQTRRLRDCCILQADDFRMRI